MIANPSLSRCAYLRSAADKDLEAKAIGCSVPSASQWDNTAPSPYGEASHASSNSLVTSK